MSRRTTRIPDTALVYEVPEATPLPADQGSLVKAITAAVVLAHAFATEVAHTLQAPKVMATINGARRLDWEEHMDDLENRKAFLRYYRMRGETGSAYFPT